MPAAAAIVDCFDLDLPLPGPAPAHSLIGINWGREEGGLVVPTCCQCSAFDGQHDNWWRDSSLAGRDEHPVVHRTEIKTRPRLSRESQ